MTPRSWRARTIAALAAVVMVAFIVPTPATAGPLEGKADEWVPSQIQPTKHPLVWSRATLDDRVTLDKLGRRPVVDPEVLTWLLACENDRQLDCVESIGLVSETGQYAPGKWVMGRTWDMAGRPDEGIGPYSMHETVWDVPGLIIDGKPTRVAFNGGLAGPGTMGTQGLNMELRLFGAKKIPSTPDSPRGCFESEPQNCSVPPDFPEGTRIRVVLRTSWLAPSGVGARGTDVTVDGEDLGGGAHRWTMTGNPMLLQSRGGPPEVALGYSKWVVSTFYFMMIDPRIGKGDAECAVFRPILFSSNAQGLDIPEWNAKQGRLDLKMQAPHFWSDRKTPWKGYYETSIPADTARCLWGIDPRLTNYLSVGVYSEDGEEKAATTSIAFADDMVQVRAYDFTFSSNIIRTKVNVKAGQPCFTKGVKIKNLTCSLKGERLVWVKSGR